MKAASSGPICFWNSSKERTSFIGIEELSYYIEDQDQIIISFFVVVNVDIIIITTITNIVVFIVTVVHIINVIITMVVVITIIVIVMHKE